MFTKKLIAVMAAGIIGTAVYGGNALAHEGHRAEKATGAKQGKNVICPVTGDKIDPRSNVTYTYKGKVYRFCCAGCIADFKKDPEKYIRKMKADAERKKKGQKHE